MYRRTLLTVALTVVTLCSNALDVKTKISIKQPGNPAVTYSLKEDAGQLVSANGSALPIEIKQQVTNDGKDQIYQVTLTARQTANGAGHTNASSPMGTQSYARAQSEPEPQPVLYRSWLAYCRELFSHR